MAAVRRAMIALVTPSMLGVTAWSALAAVTIGTNLLDFLAMPAPGVAPGATFLLASFVRVAAIFYAGYALLRLMAGVARPLAPGWAFARYAALALVLLVAFGVVSVVVARPLVTGQALERQWLVMLLVAIVWTAFTLPLLAWQTALANGAPFRAFGALWRGQSGRWGALFLGYIALVLPFAAIHLALTLIGVRLPLSAGATASLAVVDGVVQAVQLAFTCALGVVAWRLAGGAVEAGGRPG